MKKAIAALLSLCLFVALLAVPAFAAEKQADILLFGHTHNPLFKRYEKDETAYGVSLKKPLVLFNPGSVREGSFGSLKLSEKGVFASFGTI